jgi:hypothetical protein
VSGANTSFVDAAVQSGLTYSYRVVAATDAAGRCQGLVKSACASAVASGLCVLAPSFGGATAVASADQSTCGISLSWTPASSSCPESPLIRYNIYRGAVPDFIPSAANRIATCVPGPSSYFDTNNVQSGATYFYVVRAEDDSIGHGGPCSGGNEDANGVVVAGTAFGAGTQATSATWADGGGDGTALLRFDAQHVWRFVTTHLEAGANHTPGGAYAYRNAGNHAAKYANNTCAEIQTPPLTVSGSTLNLRYWERHQLEYHEDGVAVEYSVNDTGWNDVSAPSNDPESGCVTTDETSGWEALTCTGTTPVNACAYSDSKPLFTGPLGTGTACSSWRTGFVTSYAHRCHRIAGLNAGDSVQFRWRFSSDPAGVYTGLYLDDIAVTNVRLPATCTESCAGRPDATPCNSGEACTTGDACSGGVCTAGLVVPSPPEVTDVEVNGPATTTVTWTSPGGALTYNVVSSTLLDLRINGVATAGCLASNSSETSTLDSRPAPAPGNGYYYLVRASSTCGAGTYGSDSTGSPRVPTSGCP